MVKLSRSLLGASLLVLALSLPVQAQPVLGVLDGTVDDQLRTDWEAGELDGWFVLRNSGAEDAEQTLVIPSGPVTTDGRHVEVNVSINSSQEDAAIGILLRNRDNKSSCIGELTAQGTAQLFCVIDGEYKAIASKEKAGKLDGSDMLFLFEVPGGARFLVNDQIIGDIEDDAALGSELGIITFGRGTFGLADFLTEDVTFDAEPASGSGLPPRGGAAAPSAETAPSEASGEKASVGERLAARMGPLTQTILDKSDPEDWESFIEDNWFVLVNEAKASSELFYTMPVGPLETGERVVGLRVGILPPGEEKAEDFGYSAAGILAENGKDSCLGEITLGGDGLVLCFGEDGKSTEMGRLDGAAVGDGQDVIELVERPGRAAFLLNGKVIADLGDHPSMGGEVGVLAYERGEFFFDEFAISVSSEETAQSEVDEDLPDFGDDEFRFIGAYVGITNGIFLHEFGHALIGELQVPSTGPEEDAVDIFSALRVVEPTTFPSSDPDVNEIGRQVAIYSVLPWYFGGMLNDDNEVPWQDEHTNDLKRFRNTFCVIYGGNPGLYGDIATQVGLDERTLYRCEEEFNRQNRAWRSILSPHTRMGPWHPEGQLPADARGGAINVTFEEPTTTLTYLLVGAFEDYIRGFTKSIEDNYALPRDLQVTYKNCGELNAWYDPREGSITMCYELIEHLIRLVADVDLTEIGALSAKTTSDVASAGDDLAPQLDETADYGVPATNVLFPAPYRGPTPASHIRAETLTTAALVDLITGGDTVLLVDTRGGEDTLPEAFAVTDAGRDGSLTDGFQPRVDAWLEDETDGDTSIPIVFFGADMLDRSSYNAALRASMLGWKAYWYRGGIEAWKAHGLPMASELQQ